jgi:exopolyphosphatase/guanosine-5'-triphosphate,3'-diphosphate pyrophosphatase
MERALEALRVCAEKIERRRSVKVRAVATQACRQAVNGASFVDRIRKETGLQFSVISPREEAVLSVAGCLNLLDQTADAALVIDVGGGSTELSWVDLIGARARTSVFAPEIGAWLSIPMGVVTLAERFPETAETPALWFRSMIEAFKSELAAFDAAEGFRSAFEGGKAHLIGTSGAITSLAGLHLNLKRYERARVDGLWLTDEDCRRAAAKLIRLGAEGRAAEPCIGPDRADLVLAGAAILEAVQEVWPCSRVRVADRGLREGILLSLMAERLAARGKRRRRRRRSVRAVGASPGVAGG